MIRHRPGGSGHPYDVELDQRIPVLPRAGMALELRATTAPGDGGPVELELVRDGVTERRVAQPLAVERRARAGAEGHLGEASAAVRGSGRNAWSVVLDGLEADERLRYRFSANGSATAWHETVVAGWRPGDALRIRGDAGRLVDGSVEVLAAGERALAVRFALELRPGERVVGFGERFDALDQRGRRLDTVVFEQYRAQGSRTYLPVPFALVVGARSSFGFHVETTRRAWFDVGAGEPDRLWVEVSGAEAALTLYHGTPAEVIAAFLADTGPPVLPPDWVFTPWMSANEWNTQERVLAEVERSRREQIPVGVVVIEAWSDEETFTTFRDARYQVHADGAPHRLADFAFPEDGAWPDPKAMVDELHEQDIRVLLWQIPLLKAGARPGSQLAADRRALVERGLAVRQAAGRPYANRGWWFPRALLPDFTSPEARSWWTEKRRYLVEELGIDGFKTDGGEHAWGDDLRYADGTTGAESNNRYPVLYAQAYHELGAAATFSRAGFTGAATVPCHWAGDESSTWEAFRASITAGLTAGASGVLFWGWDLGGFSGEIPSAELYLRAAAMACFCPIMQYHSEFNHHRLPSRDRTPWNIAERTGDPRVLELYRSFAQLRMRLVPYLAEQARRCVAAGAPLMRAPFFAWPDDEELWRFPYQYLLGDDLFVAPVVEPGVEQQEVYLPRGEWVGFWDGKPVAAGSAVVDAPLDRIPVFVRAVAADRLLAVA